MEMGVTEKHAVGIGSADIRRIDFLRLKIFNRDHAILWRGNYGATAYDQTDSCKCYRWSDAGKSAIRGLLLWRLS